MGRENSASAYLFVVPCIKLFGTVGFICLLFLSRYLKLKWLCPLSKRHWEIHFSDRLRRYPCLWAAFNTASATKGFSFGFCGAVSLVVCLFWGFLITWNASLLWRGWFVEQTETPLFCVCFLWLLLFTNVGKLAQLFLWNYTNHTISKDIKKDLNQMCVYVAKGVWGRYANTMPTS